MVLCWSTPPHSMSSAQRNQQKWPFLHCVWVLNRVTWTWAHLNIMYLCNELELFWTGGTNYCLSYFELDRTSSGSTLCQIVDHRFLVPVLFSIYLCQWFLFPFSFPSSFPSRRFASANANSLLTPHKVFKPHNTKTNQHCCLQTLMTVQRWATSALISIYWSDNQFMYLRCVGKSIIVPQNMEVTLCVPHTYQQTQMYIHVWEHTYTHTDAHTDTLSGQGLFQDEVRLFGLCYKLK